MFAHGQLYVANKRVGSQDRLKFTVMVDKDCDAEKVPNVVFEVVLLK